MSKHDCEIDLKSEADIELITAWLQGLLAEGKTFKVQAFDQEKQRTNKQNASLHKWCQLTADGLNAAGLDMKQTLKQDAEIPWSMDRVKDFIWRPVMKAMTEKESTTEMDTVDPTKILEVIARHLANTHGFQAPDWPSYDNMIWGQREAAA